MFIVADKEKKEKEIACISYKLERKKKCNDTCGNDIIKKLLSFIFYDIKILKSCIWYMKIQDCYIKIIGGPIHWLLAIGIALGGKANAERIRF